MITIYHLKQKGLESVQNKNRLVILQKNELGELLIDSHTKYDKDDVDKLRLENYSSHIFFENNSFAIKSIIEEEINYRNLKKMCSSIISSIQQLKTADEFVCDISEYSKENQILLLNSFNENNYTFDKYIVEKKDDSSNNEEDANSSSITAALTFIHSLDEDTIKHIEISASNMKYCRDLVNSNADEITSEYLHNELEEFCKQHSLPFSSIVGDELLDERMNLVYQVGKSAQIPPRVIYCEYRGNPNSNSYISLVGKGLTYDTGGLNLKPTGGIEDMKLDMGGAATTLSAFRALVEMKVKKNIVLILGCCENSIDSLSYKPGDVFFSRNGLSVEITNTDGEGRLVLADCIDFIQEKYQPTHIIDCATLTGACMVALGKEAFAIFSNDNVFARKVYSSSTMSQELAWRLPIFEEHREVLKSNIANCSNVGSGAQRRLGGASSAAAFLEKFVKEGVKWVHLDIAGASFNSKSGATGAGVKTLIHYVKNYYEE
ncbi:MAG: leucyl aminopeptidase family protein [Candidatus Nanoarchaeia archaeon]